MSKLVYSIMLIFFIVEFMISMFKDRKKEDFVIHSKYSQTVGLLSLFLFIFIDILELSINFKNLFTLLILLAVITLFIYFNFRIHSRIRITFTHIPYKKLIYILSETLDKYKIPHKLTIEGWNEDRFIKIGYDSGKIEIKERGFINEHYEIIFYKLNSHPYIDDILDTLTDLYISTKAKRKKPNLIVTIIGRILYIGMFIAALWFLLNDMSFF